MSTHRCVVRSCGSIPGQKSFFRLPVKVPKRLEAFLTFADNPELRKVPLEKLANLRMCEYHFESHFIIRRQRCSDLSNAALPTINRPPPLETTPLEGAPNILMFTSESEPIQSESMPCITTPAVHTDVGTSEDDNLCTAINDVSTSSTIQPPKIMVRIDKTPKILIDFRSPECGVQKILPSTSRKSVLGMLGLSRRDLTTQKSVKLYGQLQTFKKKVSSVKRDVSIFKKKYRNLKKDASDKKKLVSNLKLPTQLEVWVRSFVEMTNTAKEGRRWPEDMKCLGLTIYKSSPKTYNYLRSLLPLPSPKTLSSFLNNVPFHPGLISPALESLKHSLSNGSLKQTSCCLMFDEMPIRECLMYFYNSDCISGFEDFGFNQSNLVANRATVFMVRSLGGDNNSDWKTPVAYFFNKNGINVHTFARLLESTISELFKIGLNPVALVCGQGSPNVGVINFLQKKANDPHGPYIVVNNKKLFTFYDPTHLFISVRNNLLKYNIEIDGQVVSWKYVAQAYEKDEHFLQMLSKITPGHINPQNKQKMEVKLASQVFSHTMYAAMATLVQQNALPETAMATASFVLFMDQLFDSFNSNPSYKLAYREHKKCLSNDSIHIKFWNESIEKIHNWKFVCPETNKEVRPRCQIGWVNNIRAATMLWNYLSQVDPSLTKLNMRHIGQDAVENLFSSVRQHGVTNVNPTTYQFTAALKSVIINNIVTAVSKAKNCETDLPEQIQLFFGFSPDVSQSSSFCTANNIPPTASENTRMLLHVPRHELKTLVFKYNENRNCLVTSTAYVARCFLKLVSTREIEPFSSCCDCLCTLESSDVRPEHLSIQMKEHTEQTSGLKYPTEAFTTYVLQCIDLMLKRMDSVFCFPDIRSKLVQMSLDTLDYRFIGCETHCHAFAKSISDIIAQQVLYKKIKICNGFLARKYERKKNYDRVKIFMHQ